MQQVEYWTSEYRLEVPWLDFQRRSTVQIPQTSRLELLRGEVILYFVAKQTHTHTPPTAILIMLSGAFLYHHRCSNHFQLQVCWLPGMSQVTVLCPNTYMWVGLVIQDAALLLPRVNTMWVEPVGLLSYGKQNPTLYLVHFRASTRQQLLWLNECVCWGTHRWREVYDSCFCWENSYWAFVLSVSQRPERWIKFRTSICIIMVQSALQSYSTQNELRLACLNNKCKNVSYRCGALLL